MLQYKLQTSSPPAPDRPKCIGKLLCLCKRTLSPTHNIFNAVHSISDANNMYKDILRIFKTVKACTDGRTDRQIEYINIFQLHWKVLKIMEYN